MKTAEEISLAAGRLSQEGRVVEAIAALGRALALKRRDPALYGQRAQFHLQRRNYRQAHADLNRALAAAPGNPGLWAKRAELFVLQSRLREAGADLDRAVKLAPEDWALRLARLRVLLQRGQYEAVEAELRRLAASGDRRLAGEASFFRGCIDFKRRRKGFGASHFLRVLRGWPPEEPLSMRARLYWLASRAVDPDFRRKHRMTTKPAARSAEPRLFLCGLGIFPPYTASLEVLHALSRCDVLFNNIAGGEVREFLAEFCDDIRPASYQAWQDEPKWADRIFRELRKGKKVGFVTRGHPLVFGGLAVELLARCRREEVPCESFGAVSSIDHLLAYAGKGLGDHYAGIQAFDRPAVEEASALNTRQPLLVCFYGGLSGAARIAAFRRNLQRFYPGGHPCWMFGPKYDAAPAELALAELEKRYPEIHPSLMLFVPPREAAR